MPYPPLAAIDFRSAWIPAPPEGSDPAIDNTRGIVMSCSFLCGPRPRASGGPLLAAPGRHTARIPEPRRSPRLAEIGRASCRERVGTPVAAVPREQKARKETKEGQHDSNKGTPAT